MRFEREQVVTLRYWMFWMLVEYGLGVIGGLCLGYLIWSGS